LLGSEDYDRAWFIGLKSCLVQRIIILLGSEYYDLVGQRIVILLGSKDYDLAWFKGL
jgi:hypothetical protein